MKRLLYIILYVVLAASASAQVKVTGRVIDLQNKPVSDVIVKMVVGTKTLAFTSSNAKGEYALEVKNAPTGEVTLQFTHISYEKESERVTLKERTLKVDMVLTPKAVSLKEVTVKPDPLRQRGDTLSHNLASFLGKGDVTLEDGLKRLPGVDVSKNDDTLAIGGLLCHRGTGKLYGKQWTVWYTEEMPSSAGPWKLRGLPGLIVKAEDSEGIHCFTLYETKNVVKGIGTIDNPEYQRLSRKKLMEYKKKTLGNARYPKEPTYYVAEEPDDFGEMRVNGVVYYSANHMLVPQKSHVYQPLEKE